LNGLQREFYERVFSPSTVQASRELVEQTPSTVSYLALFEAISSAQILARTKFLADFNADSVRGVLAPVPFSHLESFYSKFLQQ
jgi:hypothetical protein